MNRHPREAPVTREWRLSQYRPLTKAPFGMLTDTLSGAIFQDSQYTLVLPDKDDNEYIWGNNFQGKNLMAYMSDIVLPAIPEDPNGYVVCMPSKPWYETNDPKVTADVLFVNIKDVVFEGKEDLLFTKDKYAYWLTPNAIIRYVKDKGDQYQVEAKGYWATMLGRIPAYIAGGSWNTDGYYDSFYDKAIAAANEFISSFSAEQMVDKEASHPYITQFSEECPECHGTGEVSALQANTGVRDLETCPKCKGAKTVSYNPADRFMVPSDDWERLKDGAIKLTNPDTAVNQYHRDKNTEIMNMILRALNLLNIDAAQSGTAKAIDQEKLYTFISKVSNNMFDNIIYPVIRDIIAYRNVRATGGNTVPHVYDFTLIKPTQFQIKTAADLLQELTDSTKGNIPGYVRKKQITEFVDKRFAGDDIFQKKTAVISALDDLYVYSPDERLTMRTTGEIQQKDLIYSRNLPNILDDIIQERGTDFFKNADIQALRTIVDEKMAPLLAATKQFVVVDDNGNPVTEPAPAAK